MCDVGRPCAEHIIALPAPSRRRIRLRGDLFVADSARNEVFEISVGGAVTVVAGNGTQGFSGDGGPATAAELNAPTSVAIGTDGTLYIADTGNERIRAVKGGTISTFAGNGARGFSGDGGPATSASLNHPVALALDSTGALLVCDEGNERIRRVSAGQISTIAGTGRKASRATAALQPPLSLTSLPESPRLSDGRIFIADTANQRVRLVSSAGVISTYAGTGVPGTPAKTAPRRRRSSSGPSSLALDAANELYIADEDNHRLRRIAADGTITTVAGDGTRRRRGRIIALTSLRICPRRGGLDFRLARHCRFREPQPADPLFRRKTLHPRRWHVAQLRSLQRTQRGLRHRANSRQRQWQPRDAARPDHDHGWGNGACNAARWQGAATIALPTLGAGTHTLTATYSGDGLHPSASATTSMTISPAPVTATAPVATVVYGAPLPAINGTLARRSAARSARRRRLHCQRAANTVSGHLSDYGDAHGSRQQQLHASHRPRTPARSPLFPRRPRRRSLRRQPRTPRFHWNSPRALLPRPPARLLAPCSFSMAGTSSQLCRSSTARPLQSSSIRPAATTRSPSRTPATQTSSKHITERPRSRERDA